MLLRLHPEGFPRQPKPTAMTFSSFLPFRSQALPNGRGLCCWHPCGTLKMPVLRRVAEVRPVGAIGVGCCRGRGPPTSPVPVPISGALAHHNWARRSPGLSRRVSPTSHHHLFLSSLQVNGCRSSPVYEQDLTPRQPTSSGTAEPGTTWHLPQDAAARSGTPFSSCFSGTFWQGAGWQRGEVPPVPAGKQLCLTYFNLPINYLFSQFIEGKPCHQAPWMLAGLGRGSHPHRSSCRSWLCCCPGHEVTRGPEELNAITRRARIQVSHYIGTSVASGHKSLYWIVTGYKAPARLSPGLSMPRGHLLPSRSISLVLGGDFLE